MRDELTKAWFIALKDLRAYYFKPPTISWGILFPFVFALAFLLRNPQGAHELAPGLIAMSLIFGTTSMSTASIMFERRIGSFERVILAPVTMWGVALGKILGGVVFGLLVSSVMVPLVFLFFRPTLVNPALLVLAVLLSSFLFSGFGCFLSLIVRQEFDAMTLANAVRLPMIFLSGVFLPLTALPLGLKVVAFWFPLTYEVELLRYALLGSVDLIPPLPAVGAMLAGCALLLWASQRALERRRRNP